jgi:hypothetical protein
MTKQALDGSYVIYMDVVYAGFAAVRRSGAKTGPYHAQANAWHNYGGMYDR